MSSRLGFLESAASTQTNPWSDGAGRAQPFTVHEVHIYRYEAQVEARRSSFGTNTERSALLVCLRDTDGFSGWGEVWTGMPALGAVHRALLLEKVVAPKLIGLTISSPVELRQQLVHELLPIVRLAGEPGPVAQILAGLDCAVWDLFAKRASMSLVNFLGGTSKKVGAYASGVSPFVKDEELNRLRDQGFINFKLKAGFDDEQVLPALSNLAQRLQSHEGMMIDANCGWDIRRTLAASRALAASKLLWIEEPIGPERPTDEWKFLASEVCHPIAAGENINSQAGFVEALEWLDVLQPDLGKWGGISEVFPLARLAVSRDVWYCPHTFGTNISAAHSAHVLAAAGGKGLLELDVTDNPLRFTSDSPVTLTNGIGVLRSGHGIGVEVSLERVEPYLRNHTTVTGR